MQYALKIPIRHLLGEPCDHAKGGEGAAFAEVDPVIEE